MSDVADAQHTLGGTKTAQRVESTQRWGFLPAKWFHLLLTGKHYQILAASHFSHFIRSLLHFPHQFLSLAAPRSFLLEKRLSRGTISQTAGAEGKQAPPLAACLTGWRSKWTEIISQETQMSRFDSSCWKPCFHFPEVFVFFPQVAGSGDTGTRQQWPDTHSDLYMHIQAIQSGPGKTQSTHPRGFGPQKKKTILPKRELKWKFLFWVLSSNFIWKKGRQWLKLIK